MKALRITVTCPSCGVLGEGLTSDPPTERKPSGWTHGMGAKWTGGPLPWDRWAELDALAEKHPHPTVVGADPKAGA